MKVAYYSPLPPERSGIADYSALLLPALERRLDVIVARRGKKAPAADVALYHVGNDPDHHAWIVDALNERPGVVVLHEFVLHHLIAGMTIGRRNARGYLAAMEREGGVAGRLLGLGVLDNLLPLLWETRPEDFPLSGTVLDKATALVVHSRTVERHAREDGYGGSIFRIPHPAWPLPAIESVRVEGSPLIGCFGNLNMNKRIPQLLEAFAGLRQRYRNARLLLVGAQAERFDLDRRLERLGLTRTDAIVREDYVEEQRMWSLMAACDVCVNLRSPTMGETSGSAIRVLALGKPLVVSDVGWFGELPDDVALKIPVDEYETRTLEAALELLAADERVRAALGAAAREHVEREHDLEKVAESYAEAIELAAGGEAVSDAVLGEVSEAAAAVGLEDVSELGERLREVGVGD
jgi:glycosyltransferase involved in cell wall biosynthesis